MVEPWSGLTVLSSLFTTHGHVVLGCVEKVPVLMELARYVHSGAAVEVDFYSYGWKRWKKMITRSKSGWFALIARLSAISPSSLLA